MSVPFVHLRVHSEFSLVDGLVRIKPLAKALTEQRFAYTQTNANAFDYTMNGKADVVLSLDSDFLATDGTSLRSARQWAEGRRAPGKGKKLSRLYVAESMYTTTGTAADHRFRVKSSDVAAIAGALALSACAPDADAMTTWLEAYYQWLTTSKNGRDEAAAENNHGSWYDVQIVALALAVGRVDDAKNLLAAVPAKRIARQIEPSSLSQGGSLAAQTLVHTQQGIGGPEAGQGEGKG